MSKSQPFSWARLLINQSLTKPTVSPFCRPLSSTFRHFPASQTPRSPPFPSQTARFSTADRDPARDLLAEVERERKREREQRIKAGLGTSDIDAEDEEDYMNVTPLIEKMARRMKHISDKDLMWDEEPTDSESEEDERFTPEAIKKYNEMLDRKVKRQKELIKNFDEATFIMEEYD